MKAKKGVLLVHGLTGLPENLAPVRDAFEKAGFITHSPLLAGHNNEQNLTRSTWPEWYNSVAKAYLHLKLEVEEIYYVGLSMGGLLGLMLAAREAPELKAIALLGSPLLLKPFQRCFLIPLVRYTPLRFFVRSTQKNHARSVCSPEGQIAYKNTSFDRFPSACVFEFQDLTQEVRKLLPAVKQPLILFQGKKDHLLDPKSAFVIREESHSNIVEMITLKNSAHILPFDFDAETMIDELLHFFEWRHRSTNKVGRQG